MFQSAGTMWVPYIARALDLPIIARKMQLIAKTTELDYEFTPDDEVEDAYALLLEIKFAYPQIEGVLCGGIESNY
jgi:diphthamide synthase (EF-2-diphthine--ammonia ligase)